MQPSRLPGDRRRPWLALMLLGAYPLLGGISSLCGWMLDLPRLTDWAGSGISMQPNAAVCCAVCGLALLLFANGRPRFGAMAGLTAALIAGSTLLEWLFQVNLGIDSLLMFDRDWGRRGVLVPGRMGPAGSFSWTLIGVAFAMSAGGSPRLQRIVPHIALLTFGISLLSITGYVYDADVLFTLPRLSVMALQTATFINAVSMGLMALHADRAPTRWLLAGGAIGMIARRSIPAVVVAPILMGWLQLLGARAGLYENSFGTALLMLALTALLSIVLWRALAVIARHETALLASEERMKLAIDAGEAATWDFDLRSGKNIWSDSHYRLLGLPTTVPSDSTQALWEDAVLEEDLPAVQLEWRRAEVARDVCRAEYRLRRKDGVTRWVRSAGHFFYDDRGRANRFVGVLFDVTDEKQAIESLREADRRKNEFLAMLAHELRNPLAAVRSAVRLMQGRRVPEQQWAVDLIDRQSQQMKRLIDDLLDVSRISHGTIELQNELVTLEAVVRAAVEASRPLLDKYGHELAVELPPHPVHLDADPARLTQVFCNLLNNSARYTPGGGAIVVTATTGPDCVSVSVRDNGVGMRADMLPLVFEMFTQADRSMKQSQGGLGIGLTLVKRLVELHGGRVDARSAGLGKGSEFIVTLPLAAAVEVTNPVLPAPDLI